MSISQTCSLPLVGQGTFTPLAFRRRGQRVRPGAGRLEQFGGLGHAVGQRLAARGVVRRGGGFFHALRKGGRRCRRQSQSDTGQKRAFAMHLKIPPKPISLGETYVQTRKGAIRGEGAALAHDFPC
jgi:hypothetical protein